MKIHRFIGKFYLKNNLIIVNDREIVNQINKVLKLKIGEKISFINENSGEEFISILTKLTPYSIEANIIKNEETNKESKKEINLYCAILKKENFEWVIQKSSEIGIFKIIPIITERTIKLNININRLKRIAKEATEQSGHNLIPEITEPIFFRKAIINCAKEYNYFFDIKGQDFFKSFSQNKINLFIGPEGGWSESEKLIARSNNFFIVSLGNFVLRAETAAIIASYLSIR